MKRFYKKIILCVVIFFPFVAGAKLVPDCGGGPCGFGDLITLANNILKFLMIEISIPLAAIAFAYAGFLLVTSAGDEGKVKTAKSIFLSVLTGFIIILAAFLIVRTISTSLVNDEYIKIDSEIKK